MLAEQITIVEETNDLETYAVEFWINGQSYWGQLTIWGDGTATILEWKDDEIGGNFDWDDLLHDACSLEGSVITVKTYEGEQIAFTVVY